MTKLIQRQMQLQVQEAGVINGFSYPFTKLLTEKLAALVEKKALFEDGFWDDSESCDNDLTVSANPIVTYLSQQLGDPIDIRCVSVPKIMKLLSVAHDFLAIFEPEE